MPANLKLELKKPTRTSRNNSLIIIGKDKNMNKSTLTEEANEIFKEIQTSIKQEICAMSCYSFKDKLKKYVFDRTLARVFEFTNLNILFCFLYLLQIINLDKLNELK